MVAMIESQHLIAGMLAVLCTLAALDLWRQYALKNESWMHQHYTDAVKSKYELWAMGFQIEDLEIKLEHQNEELKDLLHLIDSTLAPKFLFANLRRNQGNVGNIEFTRTARIATHNMYRNDTSVHYITCGETSARLRVGSNDYRADSRDMCQIFVDPSAPAQTDASNAAPDDARAKPTEGPQGMFEVVPFKEGAFGLRSVATGLFLKMVPPPNDHSNLPWKMVVGGAVIGAAEIFRLSDEGYLYSPLVDGFLSCSPGQMVSAASSYGYVSASSKFMLREVPAEDMMRAYSLVDLSNRISAIQSTAPLTSTTASSVKTRLSKDKSTIRLALCVPMTSKGTAMKAVVDSPFWTNLFDSFMKSIDWQSNKIVFRFYLGVDRADALYDTGDAWTEMREEFQHRATFRMTEQMMSEEEINSVLADKLSLKIMHFDHLGGAPSQVVGQLVLTAYADLFDYFYQINDDTVISSPNWPPKLIETLRGNPIMPNLGVTGPTDSNNEKIFTHSFTHRTHVEIFGYLFPSYFKNWWSDDWISTVYGTAHTFQCEQVTIQHNVKAQKTGAWNRYEVDKSAEFHLGEELRKGHVLIDAWLKKNALPRLSLPAVCGYIPSVRYIAEHVMKKSVASGSTAGEGAMITF